jgi:hypothetical protein
MVPHMGINPDSARFLRAGRAHGVNFERTLTLGRQYIYGFGHPRLADDFLHTELGVNSLDALDASDYQGATVIHDLNGPLPEHLRGRYTAVYDGGTLEHVFNAPNALRSVMDLVEMGGHYLAVSPANNQMGHGFYQFGPDFYYRALSAETGFQVEAMVVVEQGVHRRWFHAVDPAEVGRRFQVRTRRPVEIMVAARRVGRPVAVESAPQQSDYRLAWEAPESVRRSRIRRLYDALPDALIRAVEPLAARRATSWSNGGFSRIHPESAFQPLSQTLDTQVPTS